MEKVQEIQPKQLNTERGRFYLIGNKIYPSITTVLYAETSDSLRKWKESVGEEEAAKVSAYSTFRGRIVHSLIEKYLNNNDRTPWDVLGPQVIDEINAADGTSSKANIDFSRLFEVLQPWLNVMKAEYMETALWSDALKVAGTVDFIGTFKDVPYIIDFKTEKNTKDITDIDNYALQAAAYSVMAFERFDKKIINLKILMINPYKYSESVHDFDFMFSKKLLSKLQEKIKRYYQNNIFFNTVRENYGSDF